MACLPVVRLHSWRHGSAGRIGELDFAAAGGSRETQRDVGTVEGIDVIDRARPVADAVVGLIENVDVHGLATRHIELNRLPIRQHAVRLPAEPLVGGHAGPRLLRDKQVRRGAVIVLEGDVRGLVRGQCRRLVLTEEEDAAAVQQEHGGQYAPCFPKFFQHVHGFCQVVFGIVTSGVEGPASKWCLPSKPGKI